MLDYTRKVGETDAVKAIMSYLDQQPAIADAIQKKRDRVVKEGVI